MSYCRWSSEDSNCDVYVYEDFFGGWTTHIAERRKKSDFNPSTNTTIEEWGDGYTDIPLQYAGESFNDPTPGKCADRLESLRAIGYIVPQYAIDALRDEQSGSEPPK